MKFKLINFFGILQEQILTKEIKELTRKVTTTSIHYNNEQ